MPTTADEYLALAKRYKAVADMLPPNLPGSRGREYYLRESERYGRLAHESKSLDYDDDTIVAHAPVSPADSTAPATPRPPATPAAAHPPIQLKNQVRCHSYLAVAVLAQKSAALHRAFAIWLSIERGQQTHFGHAELLEFFADATGSHPRHVRRWLDAGNGVFWQFGRNERGKKAVSFCGKDSVFAHFRLPVPGTVQFIEPSQLLGPLGRLRAHLLACFVRRETAWISRKKIRKATNVAERSQSRYDNLNGQKKQKTFALMPTDSGSEARQMPNRYHRLHLTPMRKPNKKRHGLYTLEQYPMEPGPSGLNPAACVDVTEKPKKRILFDSAVQAIAAVTRRARAGDFDLTFSVVEHTRRGNLLLKAFAAPA